MRNNGRGRSGPPSGWRQTQGGLGGIASRFGSQNSAAFLEEQARANFDALDGEDRWLPRDHRPTQALDLSNTEVSTLDTPIASHNVGFKLLMKMGWKQGQGLGRDGQGIVDPIRIEVKDESLGVGTDRIDREIAEKTTSQRRQLESEVQANEDQERRKRRLESVEKSLVTQEHLKEVTQAYHCTLCDKKYNNIAEMNVHLDSYDHNHKKRFREMQKARRGVVPREVLQKKEQAREERLMQQQMKALADATKPTAAVDSSGAKSPMEPVVASTTRSVASSVAEAMPLEPAKPRPALKFSMSGFQSKKSKRRR